MAEFARVTSLDALRDFKAALVDFAEQAGLALSEAQSDVQRTISWLSNDRLVHWQREIKKRTERLNLAKSELFRKQLESNDTRTSAVVERKNVAKMEHLVQEAEEKLKHCKKWKTALERELMLFRAQCGQVASVVAADVPITVARMEKMMDALHKYISLAAPSDRTPAGGMPNEVAIENTFLQPLPSDAKPGQSAAPARVGNESNDADGGSSP